MCKLDLHLSFSQVVWDTLLVLWIVRLASKLYSSGWHVLHLGARSQVWERLAQTGRPNNILYLTIHKLHLWFTVAASLQSNMTISLLFYCYHTFCEFLNFSKRGCGIRKFFLADYNCENYFKILSVWFDLINLKSNKKSIFIWDQCSGFVLITDIVDVKVLQHCLVFA
jgi:hypothetical protein